MTDQPVALVVGGGSGMGADAAKRLAGEGYAVGILSSSGKGEALANELGGFGVTGSNRNVDDLKRFVDGALDRWGRIDALVNSTGHAPKDPLLDITDEEWLIGMEVYLMHVVRMARLVTPAMLERGKGSIVNISTYATFEPDAKFPTSGVFRAGLAAYTKLYADRYAENGIRMNNVLPGFIDSLPQPPERFETVPMKRAGTVKEISDLIVFLAGDNSTYITGQNIRIDGGITRSV